MNKHIFSNNFLFVLLICALLMVVSGCGAKKKHPQAGLPGGETLADLNNFPQNLQVYAERSNPGKRLLSATQQENFTRRFEDIYFGPWSMRKTTVRKRDVAIFFKKARGYKANGDVWRQWEWDALAQNANLASYPSRNQSAITLRQTDLRELPTHAVRLDKIASIDEYPFDYFQYALLAPGMPLLISHATKDGKWYYVECPIASGWVDARDVAPVNDLFKAEYRTGRYAALIREKVDIAGVGEAGIGAVFPLSGKASAKGLAILVPTFSTAGSLRCEETVLPSDSAVEQPFAMTPHNVALVGNQMLGQGYGWGGTLGLRDCSAMIKDLFTPFGLWLPRNSAVQAKRGLIYPLEGLSPQAKRQAIVSQGVPFLSLLGMRGHIGLYVGEWKGEPAMFHNAWGIRIIKDGNDDERFVIGKAVVTSIAPGKELKDLYLPVTFTDRLRTLTTPGGGAN